MFSLSMLRYWNTASFILSTLGDPGGRLERDKEYVSIHATSIFRGTRDATRGIVHSVRYIIS